MQEGRERHQRVVAQNQEDPVVVVDENDDTFGEFTSWMYSQLSCIS